MRNDNNIMNNRVCSIIDCISYLFVENLLFLVAILPLLVYVLGFGEDNSMVLLFILSITIGPAITTLCSVMNKLIREGYISPVKDFWHFYRLNLLQGAFVAAILNLVIAISYFDMGYFSNNGLKPLSFVFLACIVIALLVGFYIYPIISRYNVKILYGFKLAFQLLIHKAHLSLSGVALIIVTIEVVVKARIALAGVLFGVSLLCYLVMKIEEKTINDLEEVIKKKYNVIDK